MIIRILQGKDNVEILEKDGTGHEYFKEIEIKKLIESLSVYHKKPQVRRPAILFNDQIIGASSDCIVIKQSERKRDVAFKDKVYNINFPNAIYIIDFSDNLIKSIEAYCYTEYKGAKTKLYEYSMPNMLSGNMICIGGAPREINNNEFAEALEKIIYAPYSHNTVGGLKGFRGTLEYFEFLEKEEFPYDLLISQNKKLQEVIK